MLEIVEDTGYLHFILALQEMLCKSSISLTRALGLNMCRFSAFKVLPRVSLCYAVPSHKAIQTMRFRAKCQNMQERNFIEASGRIKYKIPIPTQHKQLVARFWRIMMEQQNSVDVLKIDDKWAQYVFQVGKYALTGTTLIAVTIILILLIIRPKGGPANINSSIFPYITKLFTVFAIIFSVILLAATRIVNGTAALAVLSSIAGYVLGSLDKGKGQSVNPGQGDGSTPAGDGSTPAGDGSTPAGDGSTPAGDGSTPAGDPQR